MKFVNDVRKFVFFSFKFHHQKAKIVIRVCSLSLLDLFIMIVVIDKLNDSLFVSMTSFLKITSSKHDFFSIKTIQIFFLKNSNRIQCIEINSSDSNRLYLYALNSIWIFQNRFLYCFNRRKIMFT